MTYIWMCFWCSYLYTVRGSGAFCNFLNLLGDEILLEGWENFRGGLDNKREQRELFFFQNECLTERLISKQSTEGGRGGEVWMKVDNKKQIIRSCAPF